MRLLNFKKLIPAILILVTGFNLHAVDLHPDFTSFQSGGGMGIISFGTGWSYGKCGSWETELFLGYIPKYESTSSKATIAIKENFIPWRIRFKDNLTFEPLTASLYFTTLINHNFWVKQPDRYPSGYYRLPTKIRTNLSIGQRVKWHASKSGTVDSISAYYEIGTCDIYALSAAGNKEIRPHDWLQLCIGVKVSFRK